MLPLCFVLMPYGRKPGASGAVIDFDAIYLHLIAPAISDAGLEPLRGEEQAGGIVRKVMYERLILCEYAVADLTGADANVFYELGLRHGIKPSTTVLTVAAGAALPFDVGLLRPLPYALSADGTPATPAADRAALAERLREARQGGADSPLFQVVDGFPDIQHLKTDVFRDHVEYARQFKDRLRAARKVGPEAVRSVEAELAAAPGGLADAEIGVVIDLLLSYRAVKAWPEMVHLVEHMSGPLAATTLVQEQLGFALNRAGRPDEAEQVLKDVIARRGPSSETWALLGRVYKDRWETAGETLAGRGWLRRAVDAYLQGFQSDWRDAYPGINAVTLMELQEPPDPRRTQLIPVVQYAVERRIASGRPDYWDHATRLELAVLGCDEPGAADALADAAAAVREVWEPETTVRNLRLIREAREARGAVPAWCRAIEDELARYRP